MPKKTTFKSVPTETTKPKEERISMIHVRGGFSESVGMGSCGTQMQYTEFDDRTRIMISNKLYQLLEMFFELRKKTPIDIQYKYDPYKEDFNDFCIYIIANVLNARVNLEEGYVFNWRSIFEKLHLVIERAPYNEVLDIVWVICNWLVDNYIYHDNCMYQTMDKAFEREYMGYRFVDGKIVAITDKNEIREIETACTNPFEGCRTHIQKAVGFLADRDKKDYKNSIKESISAVESICKIIADNDKAELKEALKALKDKGLQLHGALEKAFLTLYGYASDEGGIRHGERLFESNVTFEEAKFMLVSCSAFVNYLIAEYGKQGGSGA